MVARQADKVTTTPKSGVDALLSARPSLLPFDPKDMMAIRVRPAGFAAMCGVTRQSVSQWVKKGWVTLGPDGLLDPVVATRQLLTHADPARLRARIFREATTTLGDLRARVQSLEAEVAAERAWRDHAIHRDDLAVRICEFIDRLETQASEYRTAHDSGRGGDYLDVLAAELLQQLDPEELQELRETYVDDSRETNT